MPYAFSTIDPSTTGQIARWDIPLNQWMGLKFEQGAHDTAFGAIERMTEDNIWSNGSVATPKAANAAFGIPGYLDFKEPIDIQRAALVHDRKTAELRRLAYLNTATHSGWGAKAALGTLSGMAGGVSNPLDFSLMFMPFVGSEAQAAGIAKLGGSGFSRALARGVVTDEALAGITRFPKFGASVINATFGSAATEVPNFIQNMRDQVPYGPEDAAANIFLGAATGGLFHVGGALFKKVFKLAADTHARLSPEAQDAAARAAMNEALNDNAPSPDKFAATDMGAITRDVAFDEAGSRAKAERIINRSPDAPSALNANELLILARQEADKGGPVGDIFKKLVDRFENGDRSLDLFDNMAALSDRVYVPDKPGVADTSFSKIENAKTKETRAQLYQVDNALNELKNRATAETDPLVLRTLQSNVLKLETTKEKLQASLEIAGKPLTPAEIVDHRQRINAQLERTAGTVREQRMQSLIDAERAQHEASVGNRINEAKRQSIRQQVAQGKFLTDEQVKELTKDPTDPAAMAIVKEHAANLEEELLGSKQKEGSAKTPPSPVDKIIRPLAEKDIKATDSTGFEKAYNMAAECLTKTLTL